MLVSLFAFSLNNLVQSIRWFRPYPYTSAVEFLLTIFWVIPFFLTYVFLFIVSDILAKPTDSVDAEPTDADLKSTQSEIEMEQKSLGV